MNSATQDERRSLLEQLASPPYISLQIVGTTTTSEQTEFTDFDILIDYSKRAKIKSGEFLTTGEDNRSWDLVSEPSDTFQSTSYGWISDWLGDGNSGRSWNIRKQVRRSDDDLTEITAHVKGLAAQTVYGGSIKVALHTPPLEPSLLLEEKAAVVRVEWSLDDINIRTERSWDLRVMNAMVDRARGFISLDDPLPSYGMSPFRRAMESNNKYSVVSHQVYEDGSTWTVQRFSPWGGDLTID